MSGPAGAHQLVVEDTFSVSSRGLYVVVSFASADARVAVGSVVTFERPDGLSMDTSVEGLEIVDFVEGHIPRATIALRLGPEVTRGMVPAGTRLLVSKSGR